MFLVCDILPPLALFVPHDKPPTLLKHGSIVGSIILVIVTRGGRTAASLPSLDTHGMEIYVLDEPTSDDNEDIFFPVLSQKGNLLSPFSSTWANIGGV